MTVAQAFALGVFVAALSPLDAQQVLERSLATPDAELEHGFTSVVAVRELTDGRLLILDDMEKTLSVADFETHMVRQVGRHGMGPGEYQSVRWLLPFRRDSSLLVDGMGQVVVITPSGALSRVLNIEAAGGGPGPLPGMHTLVPSASDTLGRLYAAAASVHVRRDGTTQLADSFGIQRLDLITATRDTVAYVRMPPDPTRQLRPGTASVVVVPRLRPFYSSDQWAVDLGGRIGIVSLNPYRVQLIEGDRRVTGPIVPIEQIRVTEAHRREWYAGIAVNTGLIADPTTGRTAVRPGPPPIAARAEFPDFLPAFLPDALTFAPDGRLWVQRTTSAGSATRYDVFDRSAQLALRVLLPPGSRVVGFGRGHVYVVHKDANDLQFIQRFRL